MSEYQAPVREMLFAIRDLAGLDRLTPLPGYGEATADTVEAILEEAAQLAANVISPTNAIGDRQGTRVENGGVVGQASVYGSILPAVWSFMLAARARGLGSAWTTLHLPDEREVADLLGIPYETHTQAGLFPVAYTIGTDFKPASRVPAAQLIHWDRW